MSSRVSAEVAPNARTPRAAPKELAEVKETCAPGAMPRAEAFTGVGAGGALVHRVRGVCAVGTRAPPPRACASPRTSTIIFYVAWASRVRIERSISKRTLSHQRQRPTQPRFSVRLREPRDGVGRRVGSGRLRGLARSVAGHDPMWLVALSFEGTQSP